MDSRLLLSLFVRHVRLARLAKRTGALARIANTASKQPRSLALVFYNPLFCFVLLFALSNPVPTEPILSF